MDDALERIKKIVEEKRKEQKPVVPSSLSWLPNHRPLAVDTVADDELSFAENQEQYDGSWYD